MLILKLAVLNIMRNARRSLITVLAVAVGLASLLFLWAFTDGSQEQQRDNVIRLYTGHIQIHAKGFEDKLAPELTLPNRIEVMKKIKELPFVEGVTEHVKSEALVGTSQQTKGVILIGMDPISHPSVLSLKKDTREGAFLQPEDNRKVLMGASLAKRLEVGLGDKVVIMAQAVDGTLAGYAFRVGGLIHSGSRMIDDLHVFVTAAAARELLGIEENSHEIVVRLKKRSDIPAFETAVRKFLPEDQYTLSSWDKIAPEVNQWASYTENIIRVMLIAIMAVIGVGVMNTILMSIFERTKELGVMVAIGTKPSQMIAMIFLETLVLEFIGIILGIGLGIFLAWYYGRIGIPLSGFKEAFAESFMSSIIYPQLMPYRIWECVRLLLLVTSFISLYPAIRVARMEPVKAIYHS